MLSCIVRLFRIDFRRLAESCLLTLFAILPLDQYGQHGFLHTVVVMSRVFVQFEKFFCGGGEALV